MLAAEQQKIQAANDAAEDGAAKSLLSHAETNDEGEPVESLGRKTTLAHVEEQGEQQAGPLSPDVPDSPMPLEPSRSIEELGPLSEKARGKLPENTPVRSFSSSSSSITTDRRRSTSSLVPPHQGVVTVGKNGFVPTEDWVCRVLS